MQGGSEQHAVEHPRLLNAETGNRAVNQIIPLLEPAMMVTLGGLIGMLLLAMYLPLFQMGSVFG